MRFFRFRLFRLNRRRVVSRSFALLERNRSRWTRWQAITHSVAVIVTEQSCLAVNYPDCSLVTGTRAQSATVAFFFVDFDYFS
jgi:hypothetical protein